MAGSVVHHARRRRGAAFAMDFDLVLRDVRLADAKPDQPATDIGVKDGRIAAIAPRLGGSAKEQVQGGGRLVCAGFVETHIHLDKSCILARCDCETKRFPHLAMERVSAVKHTFTVEDVTERAAGTIEKCIGHGATRMRTHVEVDPKVGLRGLEGVKALIDRYRWAIDLEICVMPQEGLINNPGTDELMVAALKGGATVVGAAPNYDTDRPAQIRRVFEMAREFDVDIDMHLDSGASAEELDTLLVCDLTEKYGWGGRVAIGHVSKLASMRQPDMDKVARRAGRFRRGAHGADGDRPLSRRPPHRPQRAAQRGRPQPAGRAGRGLLRRLQQHPQSLHAVRRRPAAAPGQHAGDRHPARQRRRGARDLGHDHEPGGDA